MKFRNRLVVVDAVRFTGDNYAEVQRFCPNLITEERDKETGQLVRLKNPRVPQRIGYSICNPGDWIVHGSRGFYPCQNDIFNDTFEVYHDEAQTRL